MIVFSLYIKIIIAFSYMQSKRDFFAAAFRIKIKIYTIFSIWDHIYEKSLADSYTVYSRKIAR